MSNETPIDLSSFPETPEAGPYILLERENARLREALATRDALYKEQWQRAEQAEKELAEAKRENTLHSKHCPKCKNSEKYYFLKNSGRCHNCHFWWGIAK